MGGENGASLLVLDTGKNSPYMHEQGMYKYTLFNESLA